MKVFWTSKRLEAVSKTSLTLFQAFLIAAVVGGVLGKIPNAWLKLLFLLAMGVSLLVGVVLADWPIAKEGG